VFGTRTSAVATLVDRATGYAMVVALPDGRKSRRGRPRVGRADGAPSGAPAAVIDGSSRNCALLGRNLKRTWVHAKPATATATARMPGTAPTTR
jgi:hypothetical protein